MFKVSWFKKFKGDKSLATMHNFEIEEYLEVGKKATYLKSRNTNMVVGIKENKPRNKDKALIVKDMVNEILFVQFSITPLVTT